MSKYNLNKVALKSHFSMGVLLSICCIFSEHLFSKNTTGQPRLTFPLDINLSLFLLINFSSVCPLQLFFVKRSNNFFSIQVFYYICPRRRIFNFFDHKNFFRSTRTASFCKNLFIFLYSLMNSNFKFIIFVIIFTSNLIYVLDSISPSFILIVL